MFQNCYYCYSVAQLCLTVRLHGLHQASCLPTPGFPVFHYNPEFAQTHVHWVWCHPTILFSVDPISSCPQSVFSNELGLKHQVAKVWELQHQHQSSQRIFRVDFLQDGLVGSPCSPRDSQESSPAPQFKGISSLALSLLYGPTLTSIHDYWKNHSFNYMDLCWQSGVSAF